MAQRTITYVLTQPDGDPWEGAVVMLTLVTGFATGARYVAPGETVSSVSDDAGAGTLVVEVPDDGAATWVVSLPDGRHGIQVAAGASTTLHALLAAAQTLPAPSALAAHAATIASAGALGHVRVGSGLAIDGDGILSATGGGGGGGVTDHGALTGLADDDHLQYHTDARGDARYSPLGHAHPGVYDPAGTAAAAVAAHAAAADPHPGYLTAAEGNAAYWPLATDLATQAELDTHAALTTAAHGGIVAATDPRLTDARTPTAHAASHQDGGADELALDASQVTSGTLAAARLPSASTTAPGIVELATSAETTAGLAVQASDTRLSDSRTPTAHAASHAAAGSDPLTLAQSQVTNLTTDLAAKEPALGNPGTNGYVLSSTTAGVRSWVAPGSGGGAPQDVTGGVLFDHFLGPISTTTATGPLLLVGSVGGAGSATGSIATPDAGTLGIVQLTPGTTTTGRAGVFSALNALRFGAVTQRVAFRFQFPSLVDGTESGAIYLGFIDLQTGAPTDGAYLYWDNTLANFRARTRNNSTETDTDVGVAPAAATWYTLVVTVNAAGTSVDFALTPDGGSTTTVTNTTNIPTAAGRETGIGANIIKSAGTTARAIYLDYCRFAWGSEVA